MASQKRGKLDVNLSESIDLKSRAAKAAALAAEATYKTFYGLAYGVSYAGLFVAEVFEADNPMCHGVRDGATAAKAAVKGRKRVAPAPARRVGRAPRQAAPAAEPAKA